MDGTYERRWSLIEIGTKKQHVLWIWKCGKDSMAGKDLWSTMSAYILKIYGAQKRLSLMDIRFLFEWIFVHVCTSVFKPACVRGCVYMNKCWKFLESLSHKKFCFYSFPHIAKTGSDKEVWSPSIYVDACKCVLSILC